VPVTVGVFALLILLVAGMRDLGALLAFSFGAFVFGTVFQEFARGARARHRQYGESTGFAVLQLLSRNRRRYGGYIVHIAIVLLFVGFAGMAFKTETEATLRPGESAELKGSDGHLYTFTHLGVSQYNALNRQVTAALLDVRRDGKDIGRLRTEKRQHVDAFGNNTFEPSTEVGIMSGLRVDLSRREVAVDGRAVHLTPNEFRLLTVLVKNAGKVLTHRQILRELWGPKAEGQTHYLRTYMLRVRRKLEDDHDTPKYFQTESGVGYRFVCDSTDAV